MANNNEEEEEAVAPMVKLGSYGAEVRLLVGGEESAALGYSAAHTFQTQCLRLSSFLATLPRLLWPLSLHSSIPFLIGISLSMLWLKVID